MDEQLINNLTAPDIIFLDADDLRQSEALARLSELASDPIYELEPGQAREFYELLSNLMSEYGSELQSNQEVYTGYAKVIWQLFWLALPAFGIETGDKLFNRNLLFSLRSGVDVQSNLQKLLNTFEFGFKPDKDTRRKISTLMERNQERLGKENLSFKTGGPVAPTIESWLKDYNQTIPVDKPRTGYDRTQYFNRSENSKKLSKDDQEILNKLIKLYDWLLFPPTVEVEKESGARTSSARVAVPTQPRQSIDLPQRSAFTQSASKLDPIKPVPVQPVQRNVVQPQQTKSVAPTDAVSRPQPVPKPQPQPQPKVIPRAPAKPKVEPAPKPAISQKPPEIKEPESMALPAEPKFSGRVVPGKPLVGSQPPPLKPRPEPKPERPQPQQQRPAPNPAPKKQKDKNALYQSALDELQKIRSQYESKPQPSRESVAKQAEPEKPKPSPQLKPPIEQKSKQDSGKSYTEALSQIKKLTQEAVEKKPAQPAQSAAEPSPTPKNQPKATPDQEIYEPLSVNAALINAGKKGDSNQNKNQKFDFGKVLDDKGKE